MLVLNVFEEYLKHFALNIGQAFQGIRYFWTHPDIDVLVARGQLLHVWLSFCLRAKRIANDLFFAILPPHWHHTKDELAGMRSISVHRWFQYGYCAWRFDENGNPRVDIGQVDRRWDPRCKQPLDTKGR